MYILAVHMGLLHAQVIYIESVAQCLERMLQGGELRVEGQVLDIHQQKTIQKNRMVPHTVLVHIKFPLLRNL